MPVLPNPPGIVWGAKAKPPVSRMLPAALLWVEIHQPKLSNGGYRISTTILAP
jgi:hypothetical protein